MSGAPTTTAQDIADRWFKIPKRDQARAYWSINGDDFRTIQQLQRGDPQRDATHRLQCLRALAFERDFR